RTSSLPAARRPGSGGGDKRPAVSALRAQRRGRPAGRDAWWFAYGDGSPYGGRSRHETPSPTLFQLKNAIRTKSRGFTSPIGSKPLADDGTTPVGVIRLMDDDVGGARQAKGTPRAFRPRKEVLEHLVEELVILRQPAGVAVDERPPVARR